MRGPALVIETDEAERKDEQIPTVSKMEISIGATLESNQSQSQSQCPNANQEPDPDSWTRIESMVDCFPEARQKLDDLFFQWISQDSSISYIRSLLDRIAKGEDLPAPKQTASPRSPIASTMRSSFSSFQPDALTSVQFQPPRSPPRSPKRKGSSSSRNFLRSGGIMENVEVITEREEEEEEGTVNKGGARKKTFTKDTIPPFYMPHQVAAKLRSLEGGGGVRRKESEIQVHFDHYGPEGISLHYFVPVCKNICGFPTFFNTPLFLRIVTLNRRWEKIDELQLGDETPEGVVEDLKDIDIPAISEKELEGLRITQAQFERFHKTEIEPYDEVARFFRLVKAIDREYIIGSDFVPFLEELLAYHPGLEFLESTPEFQDKYARTVIARIMYAVNTSWSGRITERELRKSDLLKACHIVDEVEDINLVIQYFSYEHFYVLYCKFWELDSDHDFFLTKSDLLRHGGHALTHAIVDRIFDQAARPFESGDETKMSYEDFVYFFMAEEDKTNYVSLKYWFRCIDLDSDGVIRPWEMKHFYDQQKLRMHSYSHEVVPFEDILCQMHDCLVPKREGAIVLEDFLHPHRIKISGVFFNVLFNLNKFIAYEQRDPFVIRQQREQPSLTDWDRYAMNQYMMLAQAENQREREECEDLESWDRVNESPF